MPVRNNCWIRGLCKSGMSQYGRLFSHIVVKAARLLSFVVVFKFILTDFFIMVPEVKAIKVFENGVIM
jgi:hypothetical protein